MSTPSTNTATSIVENDPRIILRNYIAKHGLKTSKQREVIAEIFFSISGHMSVEELLEKVRAVDGNIGQATVYRTMKLLTECGLAEQHQFGDGHTRYELIPASEEHHDHLICTICNKIVEFFDPEIEKLQDSVASKHGFFVKSHKMELYGICQDCQTAQKASKKS